MVSPTLAHLPPWFNMVYTDKEGNLTQNSLLYNDEMWQALNFIVEMFFDGVQMPNKTTAQITVYRDSLISPIGTVWFNTDLGGGPKLQVKTVQAIYNSSGVLITPGTIETIQSV